MTRRRPTTLLFALVLGAGVIAPAPVPSPVVQAAAGPQQVLGVATVFGSLLQRNRVYRNAAEVQDEIRMHYDRLRDQGRAALRDRNLTPLDNQLAAYLRLVAALDAEKNAGLQLLEDDKRGARQTFQSTLNREAPSIILALPGPRAFAGGLRTDLAELRDVVQAARAAAGNRPAALLDIARRRARIDQLAVVVEAIGGRPGRELAQAVGELGVRMERLRAASDAVTGEVDAGLAEAERELGAALWRLDRQLETDVRPVSVSVLGGLGEIRIPGRYAFLVALADALSASGARTHGLTREAMRDRVRQLLVEMRAAEIAAAGDCFLATGAQFRAQLAGSDPPPGSAASALLSTDLSTCDPEAVAAVLAAAAQLQPTTTTSPATIDDALPIEPGPDDPVSGEWSITWGDPSSSAAQQYVVSTENASVTNEGSVTYWHPTLGGDTPAGSPVGTIVYHIPIPGTIAGGEVHLTLTTFHWDYSQGSAAVDGSTDGTTWQVLDEIGPPAFGEANSGGLSGPLPELFSGASEVWLRVRLVAWGPQAAGGAPWTNTSQHGRADAGAAADTFRLRVDLAP